MPIQEVESLKAAFSSATWWDEAATAVVVAGVLIELVALWFDKEMSRLQKWVLVPAAALVVVGVAGELVFGGRASSAASRLQQLSDQKVAALQREQANDHRIAMSAAAHAADLGVTVDNLQGFVAKKQAVAEISFATLRAIVAGDKANTAAAITALNAGRANLETARKDALVSANAAARDVDEMQHQADQLSALLQQERALHERLVSVLTPRGLSAAQQTMMARELARFAPIRADVIICGDEAEIADLARLLAGTLGLAGWHPKVWSAMNGPVLGLRGVAIMTERDTPNVLPAAFTLARALNSDEIAASVVGQFQGTNIPIALMGPTWDSKDIGPLRIFVGTKP